MIPYTDTIRRWATDTRRAGTLTAADGTGEVGLGDDEAGRRLAVRFALRVRGGVAETVRFEVFGCGFTIAACAAAAELAEGRALDEIAAIAPAGVDDLLQGLPPERVYCAELAVEALRAAVDSARGDSLRVASTRRDPVTDDHPSRGAAADPVYRLLTGTPSPPGVAAADRHLFACLLNAAAKDPYESAAALGLAPEEIRSVLKTCFPGIGLSDLERHSTPAAGPPPAANAEVLGILLTHLPRDGEGAPGRISAWFARMVAARAAHPGHLWVAMGLFERPELTAAIRRHLPGLAAANDRNMRWKRYLFKRVCDLHGAVLCKVPDCGECSDYALCFATDS